MSKQVYRLEELAADADFQQRYRNQMSAHREFIHADTWYSSECPGGGGRDDKLQEVPPLTLVLACPSRCSASISLLVGFAFLVLFGLVGILFIRYVSPSEVVLL